MTVALIRIRDVLRRALVGRRPVRRRVPGSSIKSDLLESRQLLSAAGNCSAPADQDRGLQVDGLPLATEVSGATSLQAAAPYDLAQTFLLNSLAGATKTIYLDF